MSKTLSIITVNYNGLNDTIELLSSIYSHLDSVEYEIIVVDNGSKVDESVAIKNKFPQTIVIREEINKGFAGGNNSGIKIAKGDYILLLNNDTIIADNSILNLIERCKTDKSIGVVSPKIKFYFGDQNIQFAGYTPLSKITLRNNLIGFGEVDNKNFSQASQTPYAHGAAMLVKKEVIEKVGLMPEVFFLYYEELDWCQQITEDGYEIWYEPNSLVYHKESQSTGQNSPFRLYYLTRNRLLFAWRNLHWNKYLSIIYQLFFANFAKIIFYLLKGKVSYSKSIIKGELDFLRIKNKNSNIIYLD